MPEGVRICEKCQKVCGPHQPDACLGELPGVVGACCGHGDRERAFIGWTDGPTIRGFWVDEEWRAKVAGWKHEEQREKVQVSFELYRGVLDGTITTTDEDLRNLGDFVIAVARDQVERHENYMRVWPA